MTIAHEKGSKEFHRPLRKLGVPCAIGKLRFADFAFMGQGPHGLTRVGVERKRVAEIVDEQQYKRFKGHQLPGLIKAYDFRYVIVEGDTRVDPHDGILMAGKWEAGFGVRTTYESYQKRLCTLYTKSGIVVWTTRGKIETRHYLHALYRWWQKPWHEHKSAYQVDEQQADHAIIDVRTAERSTYAQWPGIGWTRSRFVAEYFSSIARAVEADEDEWCEVRYKDVNKKWHRFGPGRAATIRRFLNGESIKREAKG